MSKFLLSLFISLCSLHYIAAQTTDKTYVFNFNPKLRQAFDDVINLKLRKAKIAVEQEKNRNAFNLVPVLIDDYIDFFKMFIDERHDLLDMYLTNRDDRLALLKLGNPGSPYTLYAQAEVYLHWALIYIKMGYNVEAFKSIRKANALLSDNAKVHPNFVEGKKALALVHAMVGSIPGEYKWGASLAGLKGDTQQGIEELKEVINYGKTNKAFEFNKEVQIVYGLVLIMTGNKSAADWKHLNKETFKFTESPMAAYIAAHHYMRIQKSVNIIRVMKSYPKGEDYHPFHYLDYLHGMYYLYRLDYKKAEPFFKNYLSKYRGINNIKSCYHKMAWIKVLKQEPYQYKTMMKYLNERGEAFVYDDIQAVKEYKKNRRPNLQLLQSKILFDGGYYERAFNILKEIDEKSLKEKEDQVALNYRIARIKHLMKQYDEAIDYYEKAYKKGAGKPYYYAANSALQIGLIKRKRKKNEEAIKYFNYCLKQKPSEHKDKIHKQAKQELDLLKKKKKKK